MADAPCWPVDICESCCTDQLAKLDPEQKTVIEQAAAMFLWNATGQRFGLCETTVRPCRINCGGTSGLPYPTRVSGEWVNLSCNRCASTCGCDTISEVTLEDVASIVKITIDGIDVPNPEVMAAVYDHRRVIRIDGQEWPSCQNLSSIDGAGTWSITYLRGVPIPKGGAFMAGLLTCELAKACLQDTSCRLPRRIQSITRNQVTMGFQDAFENLPDMLTGLWELDAWITAARNTRFRQPAITSVDRPRAAELTWPLPA